MNKLNSSSQLVNDEVSVRVRLRKATVSYSSLGTIVVHREDSPHGNLKGSASHKRVKGDLTTFSKTSARRLREKIQFATLKDTPFVYLSATLTIPDTSVEPDSIRDAWHWFRVTIPRVFPDCGWIWRIELQRRGTPHWHFAVLCPASCNRSAIEDGLRDIWFRFLERLRVGMSSVRGARKNSVYAVWCQDPIQTSIYLATHSSKHKRDQLGWIGRQWGVINACVLSFEPKAVKSISGHDLIQAKRFLRKYYHARLRLLQVYYENCVSRPCHFGRVLKDAFVPNAFAIHIVSLLEGRVSFGRGFSWVVSGLRPAFKSAVTSWKYFRHPNSCIGFVGDVHAVNLLRVLVPAFDVDALSPAARPSEADTRASAPDSVDGSRRGVSEQLEFSLE